MRSNYRPSALVLAAIVGATWTIVWLALAWLFESSQQAIIGIVVGLVVFIFTYLMQRLMQWLFDPGRRL